MTLYEKLQTLCRAKGFEISNLGEHIPDLKITKGSITGWKKGAKPRADKIKTMADYFEVPIGYLTDDESINIKNINENHGVIGNTHAPITIINGSEKKLSEQELALLEIFGKLDIIKKAQLLAYAAELEKKQQ